MTTQGGHGFEKASNDAADPVGHVGDDWGFWDETWSVWHGGHADEAGARKALLAYASTL